ncbi:MAG: hypothetical protein ACRD0C_01310 [Acidimicrobiia bacterium]
MATAPFLTLASTGCEEAGLAAARRCAAAAEFLGPVLGPAPGLVIWALNPPDWERFSPDTTYGMPHYAQGNLYLAGGRAEFWQGLAQVIADRAGPAQRARFARVYGRPSGEADLSPFFDLLAVHELAHAFTWRGSGAFPRRWLAELFANLCLHAYVVGSEPDRLEVLEVFPEVYAGLDAAGFPLHTLADFEAVYSAMDGSNYAWFQSRFHRAAARIHDVSGVDAVRRLWRLGSQAEELLARQLEAEAGGDVADVLRSWPA